MRFEAKKKLLATAISEVQALTSAVEMGDGSSLVLDASGKNLKVASPYAEATVSEVIVKEKGTITVDQTSLTQALKVSGETFKLSAEEGNSSAFFTCGRSKGPVSLRDEDMVSALKGAPKASIHVPGLQALLRSIALRASGQETDRTLHFDGKKQTVRGESSDTFRAVMTFAQAGDDVDFESAALSLPQKATDVIAKLVGDSRIGFNEQMFTVKSPGFRCVVPLSSNAPLKIKAQLDDWLASQTCYGDFTVSVQEIKAALADAMSMIGNNLSARLVLKLDDSSDAKFEGESEAGEIESDFTVAETNLEDDEIALSLSATYMKECLDFYKTENVKVTIYQQAVAIDLTEGSEEILSQTTIVPLLEALEDADAEEKPKAKKKATKKKAKAKDPEPEEDEEEPEDDDPEDDDLGGDDDEAEDDDPDEEEEEDDEEEDDDPDEEEEEDDEEEEEDDEEEDDELEEYDDEEEEPEEDEEEEDFDED